MMIVANNNAWLFLDPFAFTHAPECVIEGTIGRLTLKCQTFQKYNLLMK